REAEVTQKSAALVVRGCRGYDSDVHATNSVNLVRVNLMEHRLFREPESVVAISVELLGAQSAEVANTGKCRCQQAVEELPHAVATQSYVGADGHSVTQLELRDRLARAGDLRLLAGD